MRYTRSILSQTSGAPTLKWKELQKGWSFSRVKKGKGRKWYSLDFPSSDTGSLPSLEFSPREKSPREWLVETDRKRDFYILIQIGKQFVFSFENHRTRNRARACAPIWRSFATSWKYLSILHGGAKNYNFPNRKSFRKNVRGAIFWTLRRTQWKRN